MSAKYTVWHARNKECPYYFDWETNSFLRALWWLLTLSIKYPIVNFEMRRGEIPCGKCSADWCDKSGWWKRKAEAAKSQTESSIDRPETPQ